MEMNCKLCPPQSLPDFPNSMGCFSKYHNSIINLKNYIFVVAVVWKEMILWKQNQIKPSKQNQYPDFKQLDWFSLKTEIHITQFSNPPVYWNILCIFPDYGIWGHLPTTSSSALGSVLLLSYGLFFSIPDDDSWLLGPCTRGKSVDTLLIISVPMKGNLR